MGSLTPSDLAMQRARTQVATIADALIVRHSIDPFDEGLGSRDYARWRRELITVAATCGADFAAALVSTRAITPAPDHAEDQVDVDSAASDPTLTIPQIRQQALLSNGPT
eukprot:CAMPEP_0183341348 /NCGR_PEP_ID=MMETSP0164_2-20130417/7619_1 /TAXON_ID=221442 /ORGANISM="Coccolithus pelagicus ssp braarudi, Strain PLY182g" /LENGTH=109 /DNA_ID=CAMNT_0025511643 /DNA_START=471 /DNA_END=800 /DNA_ORIENTATION=-